MRRSFALVSALLALAATAAAQTSSPQQTPEALTAAYNQAFHARDWSQATYLAEQLVAQSPTAEHLCWLGDAQMQSAQMDASLATYDRALAAAQQEKPAPGQPDAVWKTLLAKIHTGRGDDFLKLRRNPDAIAEFQQAAALDPNPAVAYWNLCVTLYNTGTVDGAVDACHKAIQLDPARADAWFVLGSLLYGNATTDAGGKIVISAEARQALNKYLELAPTGPHAADVKAMLSMAAQ